MYLHTRQELAFRKTRDPVISSKANFVMDIYETGECIQQVAEGKESSPILITTHIELCCSTKESDAHENKLNEVDIYILNQNYCLLGPSPMVDNTCGHVGHCMYLTKRCRTNYDIYSGFQQ